MFNPDIQYRCDIIRGKAQKELEKRKAYAAAAVNKWPFNAKVRHKNGLIFTNLTPL